MISQVTGTVLSICQQAIVLNLGAIAFDISIPDAMQLKVGDTVSLYVYTHWNQEQGPTLFGFVSPADRELFKLVLDCSGIGPKIALKVVSDIGIEQFIHAIKSGETASLNSVSGIGQRKAEQIIFHLKGKVDSLLVYLDQSQMDVSSTPIIHDITQALKALNYSRAEINQAVTHIKADMGNNPVVFDQLFRKALLFLTR